MKIFAIKESRIVMKFLYALAFRLFEEIFPFIVLFFNRRKVQKKPILENQIKKYSTLSEQVLLDRIMEEQKRGASIEEKTFKFYGVPAIGLTLINLILFLLAGKITYPGIQFLVNLLISSSVLYLFIGALISLYAIKTHPIYGYGTKFSLDLKCGDSSYICADALAKQEKENIIRNLRNETSFQSVRNGLFCLFIATLFLILFILSY